MVALHVLRGRTQGPKMLYARRRSYMFVRAE